MIQYLYLDNFRGFTNTYIPISDVNFLVGENSTGKTSVLSVLRLLSSSEFWFQQSFAAEGVDFRLFSDVVSAHSERKGYFRLGLIEEFPASRGKQSSVSGQLFTFTERDSLPHLASYSIASDGHLITVRPDRSTVRYRHQFHGANTTEEMLRVGFPLCVADHNEAESGFLSVKPSADLRSLLQHRVLLPLLISEVAREIGPAKKNKNFPIDYRHYGPRFSSNLAWIAPIRTKPRRTYDEIQLEFSPAGEHTPYLIRKILGSKTGATKFRAFLNRVGAASGLFQSVQIRRFGRGAAAPFEVDVLIDDKAFALGNVGYGVSQSLPVIVEVLSRSQGSWFAIQQPEVHLHPRAQAALGDVFFEAAVREGQRFMVETHSDFTIDRFRMNYQRGKTRGPNGQILFFERRNRMNTVVPIRIGSDGQLPEDQPEGYRQFFIKEELRLLGI